MNRERIEDLDRAAVREHQDAGVGRLLRLRDARQLEGIGARIRQVEANHVAGAAVVDERERDVRAGDAESGVTVMRMEAGLDTGPMLLKVVTPISAEDTGGSLHDRLAEMGPPAVVQAIAGLADGSLQGEVQDDALATYAHKLNKDEARIDWSRPAVELERLIQEQTAEKEETR